MGAEASIDRASRITEKVLLLHRTETRLSGNGAADVRLVFVIRSHISTSNSLNEFHTYFPRGECSASGICRERQRKVRLLSAKGLPFSCFVFPSISAWNRNP